MSVQPNDQPRSLAWPTPVATPTFLRVARLEGETRRQMLAIYEDAFPPNERMSGERMVASIARGERECYLACGAGRVLGFAITMRLHDPEVTFLDYIATDRNNRNGGVGGALLEHVRRDDGGRSIGMILEVDRPQDAPDVATRDLWQRRINMYERHGGQVITAVNRWVVKERYGAGPRTVRFGVMWLPGRDGAPPPDGAALRQVLAGLYKVKYPGANRGLLWDNLDGLSC